MKAKNESQLEPSSQETTESKSKSPTEPLSEEIPKKWYHPLLSLGQYGGKALTFLYNQISPVVSPFLKALFDFSFKEFFTLKLVKPIFLAGVIVLALIAVSNTIDGFQESGILGIFGAILSLVLFFFEVVLFRVGLEVIIAVFRIGEDLKNLVLSTESQKTMPHINKKAS